MGAEPEEESDTSSTVPSYRPPHCGQKRRRVRSRFGGALPCRLPEAAPGAHRSAAMHPAGGHGIRSRLVACMALHSSVGA
jgi:hypothetical protein